jgi:hypothetical protein
MPDVALFEFTLKSYEVPCLLAAIFYSYYFRMPARLNAVRTGKQLLKQDKYKNIIIESLKFLVFEKRISLYAFVLMSNHIHLIWQARQNESFGLALRGDTPDNIQHSLLTHTVQQINLDLEENHP